MTDKEIRLPDGLDVETATDVLREYASTEDATIAPSDTLESLRAEIKEAKDVFAAVLAEESPQSADTLARQDMDALTEPFRGDEGDIEVDTLRQEPVTGDGAGDPEDPGDDPTDLDTLSFDERQDIQRKARKRQVMLNRDMDNRAAEIEAEICDTLGYEDFADIELEAL